MNFEPGTTLFSATNPEALAVAATIAYEPNNTTAQRRAEKELGLDQFFGPFEHHNFVIDTEGFIAASEQHVVLAFRGTEPGKIKAGLLWHDQRGTGEFHEKPGTDRRS